VGQLETLQHKGYVVVHVASDVPVAKLCRALATHGLVLSNGPDGRLWLHPGPGAPSGIAEAQAVLKGEPPSVQIRPPRGGFMTRFWRALRPPDVLPEPDDLDNRRERMLQDYYRKRSKVDRWRVHE
jgi:hypothetical protein